MTINPIDHGTNLITPADGTAGVIVSGTATPGDAVKLEVIDNLVGHTVLTFNTTADAGGAWTVPISPFKTESLQDLSFTLKASDTTANISTSETITNQEHVGQVSINPINAINTISTADVLHGVTITGIEHGLDGQTMLMDLHSTNPAASLDLVAPFTANEGTWSATFSPDLLVTLHSHSGPYAFRVEGPTTSAPIENIGSSIPLAVENVTVNITPILTDTATHLAALMPTQIDFAHNGIGVTSIVSTGPGDTEFSAAQVRALESNGLMVSGPKGAQIELSDSAANVASLLGGRTWAEVEQHVTQLQKTGVTDVDVQLPHQHEFEFSLATLDHLVEQQLATHSTEPAAKQTQEIDHFLEHWHL